MLTGGVNEMFTGTSPKTLILIRFYNPSAKGRLKFKLVSLTKKEKLSLKKRIFMNYIDMYKGKIVINLMSE
jgi:hypothetical protein